MSLISDNDYMFPEEQPMDDEEKEPRVRKYKIEVEKKDPKGFFTTPRNFYTTTATPEESFMSARDYLEDILRDKKSPSKYVRPTIEIKELEGKSVLEKVKTYESTKNKCILYQLFSSEFLDYFRKLWEYNGTDLPDNVLTDVINTDIDTFSNALKKYAKSPTKEEILKIAKDFYLNLYLTRTSGKSHSATIAIHNKKVLLDILDKCVSKGITIDPIISHIKDVNFNNNGWETTIGLVYFPFLNIIVYNGYSINSDYSGISTFINYIADLPEKDKIGEEMIKINDKLYSKKSFESLVETDFDNFIDNLEIDCLLDKKDTDAVVEKLNLL